MIKKRFIKLGSDRALRGLRCASFTWLGTLIFMACFFSGCAATVHNTDCGLKWMGPVKRVTPPSSGDNKVWVDFQDQVGEGIDLRDQIIDTLTSRGYVLETDYEKADYVLWASLRYYDEVEGKEGGMAKAHSLGPISRHRIREGRINSDFIVENSYVPPNYAPANQFSFTDAFMNWLFMQKEYALIMDVQLGEKVAGGVDSETRTERNQDNLSLQGQEIPGGGTELARTEDSYNKTQNLVRKEVYLQLENRLVVSARGVRLDKQVATEAISEKLSKALGQLLPRAG